MGRNRGAAGARGDLAFIDDFGYEPARHAAHLIALARHWKADGIVLNHTRYCPLIAQCRPEVKRLVDAAGFPVRLYECNCADARENDVGQITRRLSLFIDLL